MRKRHRRFTGEDTAIGLPDGIVGNARAVDEITELRELLGGRPVRREQAYRLAVVACAFHVILEDHVVDHAAAQIDRARNARCVDADTLRAGQRRLEVGFFLRLQRRIDEPAGARVARGSGGLPIGNGSLFGRGIGLVLNQRLFGLRIEKVHRRSPAHEQQEGKRNGDDHVAMVVQGRSRLCPVENLNVGRCLSLSRQC